MITIKEVAKRAGTSPGSVSKVLLNYEGVSEELKQRVKQAVDELGFVPNETASRLSSKRKTKIGVIDYISKFREPGDEFHLNILLGVTKAAALENIECSVIFSHAIENMDEIQLKRFLRSKSLNGLIVFGITKNDKTILNVVKDEKYPTVLIDSNIVADNVSSIMTNNQKAAYDVAALLNNTIENNNNQILCIAGNEGSFVSDLRIKGLEQFCIENKYQLDIEYADFSRKKAFDITAATTKEYRFISCASDLMAIGCILALRKRDHYTPVCGFDGLSLLGLFNKDIYTVRQRFTKMSDYSLVEMKRLWEGSNGRIVYVDHQTGKFKDLTKDKSFLK